MIDKLIDKLTPKQERQLVTYMEEAFGHAVSTRTNRIKAEKWALRLTKDLMKGPEINWCTSPEEAKRQYDRLWDSLWDVLDDPLDGIVSDSLGGRLWDSLDGRFGGIVSDSLGDSLCDRLWDILVERLCDSLRGSLWDGLWASLRDRLRDSLRDAGWIAFYSFAEEIGVEFSKKDSEKLKCHRELLKHCFAIYVVPGHIILVDRPKAVAVKGGNLVGIEFG